MKYFLFVFVIFLSAYAKSQTLCDDPCTPDNTCSPNVEKGGYCPYPAPDAVAGEYYDVVLTVVAPKSGEHNGTTVNVDCIDIIAIEGLPEGIVWCKSTDKYVYNQPGCLHLTGIPTQIGSFPLIVKVKATVLGFIKVPVEDKTLTLNVIKSELPTVDFEADAVLSKVFDTVHFTSNTDNGVTHWEWNFENGNPSISNATHPSVVWTTPGHYTVSLTVHNAKGDKKIVKYNYLNISDINENLAPLSQINVAKRTGVIEEIFTFSDSCTADVTQWTDVEDYTTHQIFCNEGFGETSKQYFWTFEGGTPLHSIEQRPKVYWEKAGIYSVSLAVSNANGTDELYLSNYMTIKNIDRLKVYPNPAGNFIVVEDKHIERIDIFSPNGAMIFSTQSHSTHNVIETATLGKQTFYFLRVTYSNGNQISRIIHLKKERE
ncbi:MAG: PKD domain-containing protein [Bacteroidales bacterium]|jgi:PKD repeat protein|nr:PKD domain-containing protein [Bacteroidales bacterium]